MGRGYRLVARIGRPFPQTFNAAVRTLASLGLSFTMPQIGVLRAAVPISIYSWGENVELFVIEDGPGATHVMVTSQSKVRATLIDWGKNRRNAKRILGALMTRLDAMPPMPEEIFFDQEA